MKNRKDHLLIDGNSSLHAIGLLSLFIGACFGIWLWFAPSPFVRAPQLYTHNERHTGLPEDTSDFFLLEKNGYSPHNPPRHVPAHSVQRSTAKTKTLVADRKMKGATSPGSTHATSTQSSSTQTTSTQSTQKNVRVLENETSLLHQGDQLKKHSDYSGAYDTYRRVLAQSPQNGDALAGMGDLYRYSGQLDSAIQFYRAALVINPRNAVIHNGLGTALYENSKRASNRRYAKTHNIPDPAGFAKAQYDSAITEYTEAIELDSSGVTALTNRGVLRELNNDHDAAIKDYSLAIRLKPSDADAYSKRAATYKDLGKLDAAVADYSAAIKLDSTSYEFDPTLHFANAYFGRGVAYYKMGEIEKAIADFDSTLALSPKHTLALISKGIALADKQEYDSAITEYTKAISLLSPLEYNGARMVAFLQMGNSWKALGKYDTAIVDYQNAMESPKLASKACWRVAECLCFKKDATNALIWLKKAKSFGLADVKKWDHDREVSMLWNMPEFKELTRE